MQVRYIAFVAPAALVTALIFLLTSSIVLGLEATLAPPQRMSSFEVVRHETECEKLERGIEEVAREVHSCETLPGCLRSRKICPASMQEAIAREYERLRVAVRERCSGAPTFVTRSGAACSTGVLDCSKGLCIGASVQDPVLKHSPAPGVFLF